MNCEEVPSRTSFYPRAFAMHTYRKRGDAPPLTAAWVPGRQALAQGVAGGGQ